MNVFSKSLATFFVFAATAVNLLAESPKPISPTDNKGRPLNLDFEDGTLKDWTATGTAFDNQPVHGDAVAARRGDMKSNHRGDYWIGTYEKGGDAPQGTLTSVTFKVTQPYASFLVGGGHFPNTSVELVHANNQRTFLKISGNDTENMLPVVVDLSNMIGRQIFIRLTDAESGGWGHLNFDDFKFYATKPDFADAIDPDHPKATDAPPADTIKFAGLEPEQAAKEMTLPSGFKATLFAGEPDIVQPIAFAMDDRGRIWVAEGMTYPQRAPEGQGKDRILCFEDTNGDGKFDKRTVFMEGLNLVSGLQVGFGGVWVGAAPYLMFIPMKDGAEPKPSGPPQILLDGWGYQDTHETLNTFTWGPDGWLYGCHGVFTLSKVGKPGTPEKDRTIITCGVWRFHPIDHRFEYFAEGSSNPWGIDFDVHGQCITEGCVIPHLWHMIEGGHFQRQGGNHVNPYVYDDIKTIADHLHYAGSNGPHAANGRSAAMGGGHAHAGLMIYQGESWPTNYQGKIFINNVHGARMNMDVPERQGSGFVGHHGKDFIDYNDTWSQVIDMQEDQNGSVFMIDWYDKNRCHNPNVDAHDRSNGRIFKLVYNNTKWTPVDVQKLSDAELVKLQLSKNDWMRRHASRVLEERYGSAALTEKFMGGNKNYMATVKALTKILMHDKDSVHQLHALWTLHNINALSEETLLAQLKNKDEYLRAWSIQFLAEKYDVPDAALKEFARLAHTDKSPVVRLYLASALQRVPVEKRWDTLAALDAHAEDATDHNLPFMYWYAAEPLPTKDISHALQLAEAAQIPNMLSFTVRRVAALGTPEAFAAITDHLLHAADDAHHLGILNGLSVALQGQRNAKMPSGWEAVETQLNASANADIRAQVQSLSLVFGSANALAALRKTMMDESAQVNARRTALEALLGAHDRELAPLLLKVLNNPDLQGPALRGLAAYDHPKTAPTVLAVYPNLVPGHKRDALNTLASRVDFAKPLLAAMEKGTISYKDLTADLVRQLRGLKDAEIEQQILKLWGVSRDSSADMKADIAKYKKIYYAGGSQPGDASRGRAIFARTCQQCHTLFGTGGHVGPDLTGSQRADLDYILLNVVDPNAVIPNDYRASNIETKDGRSITGIVTKQDDKALTVVTANETLVIPRGEVESQKLSPLSMMPEGLLQPLSDQEVRDLIYYLGRPGQVPLPATNDAPVKTSGAMSFFNGKDLAGWEGDMNLWKVENGEIVGKTGTGLKHNEFLKNPMVLENFRLVLKLKLVPNGANSGVQFRSEKFGDYEMRGPQADVGAGWWGKLYEENGRAILSDKPGDPFVNTNDWNTYEILAVDGKIRTALNGHLCVDLDDQKISRRGITGLQVHSGGPTEVRFKDFQLELNPKFEMTTVRQDRN